jgi:hypothetical protein
MPFDTTLYETLPQTNVAGTLALIRSTITASKGVPLPAAKKALKRVRASGEELRTLHQATPPAKAENVTKAADASMDRIWSAVEQRLAAHLELGGDAGAEAERVHGILFPRGMGFLGFRYAEQWAEGEAIVGRIASEKLEPSLDSLVGHTFVKALRERHAAYGEALGITKQRPTEVDPANLLEPLRAARAALATYMRVVVAAVDNGDFDESEGTAVLSPIAALRQSLRSTKKKGAEPVVAPSEPAEPLPPVE